MARKTLDEAEKARLQRIADRIFEKVKALDGIYYVEGMHQLPVLRHDSEYRQAPIDSSIEFLLSSVRVGGRGQIIFCFEPADNREFKHIEVEQRKMDDVFPLFGPAYAEAIGSEQENFEALINETSEALELEDEAAEIRKAQEAEEALENNRKLQNYGRF
jgi:hypothetical protein